MRSKFKNYTFIAKKGEVVKTVNCRGKKDFDYLFNRYLDEGYTCVIGEKKRYL